MRNLLVCYKNIAGQLWVSVKKNGKTIKVKTEEKI